MGIEQISARLIDGLLIITFLTALVLLAVAGRRRSITIGEVADGTGRNELKEPLSDASARFRLNIGTQLEKARKTVADFQEKVKDAADRCYALEIPDMKGALIAYQDSTLASLLTSLERGPSQSFAAQFQALAQLLFRSRGAAVTATIHLVDRNTGRLGISVEVVSPSSSFVRRRLLVEEGELDVAAVPQRIDEVIRAGACCAAIDLSTWALQWPSRLRYLGGRGRRAGLAYNMAGLLMNDSAKRFGRFAVDFRQFACEEFEAAIRHLPNEYEPHFNLASVREDQGEYSDDQQSAKFISAVNEYCQADHAAGGLPDPARRSIRRTILVRKARAELISGISRYRKEALEWLHGQPLEITLDCRYKMPAKQWLRLSVRHPKSEIVLDRLTADYLYNSACMHAIAAEMESQADWDQHARFLLGAALVIDAGEGDLWDHAKHDDDLKSLSWHLPEFLEVVSEVPLSDDGAKKRQLPEILELVDHARKASDWSGSGPPSP